MSKRFSSKVMAAILQTFLKENLDTHQYRGEFVEGCLQCEKCKIIREIAIETHNSNIINAVLGKPPSQRGKKTAYAYGSNGQRIGFDDTDKRVPARVRRGK